MRQLALSPPSPCHLVTIVYTSLMTTFRQIKLGENGRILLERVRWCADFASKLRGFTFRRHLAEDDGLVLVEKSDSRV
ncbi:MAG: hypothetical protein P8183_11715, partial [Anaerolineae bacterium]